MIKAVFFDFDGVLTTDKNDVVSTCRCVASKLNLPYQDVQKAYLRGIDVWQHYRGQLGVDAVWKNFYRNLKQHGMKMPYYKFAAMRRDAFRATPMDEKMVDIAKILKDNGYPIGIITDNGIERVDILTQEYELDKLFQYIIVSEKEETTKHKIDIFNLALDNVRKSPQYHDLETSEVLFIDNNPDNCKVADKAGLQSIHFDETKRDYQGLEAKIRGFGVAI
jgi:putative hydrolase of the HAD superfamily